jgi:hypothetical protein
MSLLEHLNLYFKIFYFAGVAPYITPNIVTKPKIRSQTFVSYLPCITLFAFSFVLEIVCAWIVNFPERLSYVAVENIIANLFIICDSIKNFSIFIPICFYSQTITKILSNFVSFHTYFQDFFQWQINYDHFRKCFAHKFIFLQIAFWQNAVLFTMEYLLNSNIESAGIIYMFWKMVSLLAFSHVMLYVDLLRYYLYQLNLIIRNDVHHQIVDASLAKNKHMKGVKELLIQNTVIKYKTIYYRLWDVSQKINSIFGWTIAALLLQAFADATYCIFWLYDIISDGGGVVQILRKFLILHKPRTKLI